MESFAKGVRRVTFRLPFGLDHVHCYLVAGAEGDWMVVDTGLGLPDARARWAAVLEDVDGPVTRIVVTHFHPDHVGASADLAELTGATVFQGAVDYAQCVAAWGEPRDPYVMSDYLRTHGLPDADVEVMRRDSQGLRTLVRFARDPEPIAEGDRIAGWEVVHLPGHADGHLALLRDGVLLAGDSILGTITPNVGLYPNARPDPLADYLASLGRIGELAPRVALPGHGEPVEDPAGRAAEIAAHHHERLEQTAAALTGGPVTAYEASLVLFPEPLDAVLRRFALAETRAHLEYLVLRASARREERNGTVRYATA